MKRQIDQNNELRQHVEALRKVELILSYPESLAHEVRRGWPELQMLLRGIYSYFSKSTVTGGIEDAGLQDLCRSVAQMISTWLQSPRPPLRQDVQRFRALADELILHLEHHLATNMQPAHDELPKKRAG